MPRGLIRPRPEPERARARRNGKSRSGRRARRRRGSGDGSAGNRKMRSSGCASSWDSLPWRLRSTRRRTRKRRRVTEDELSPRGGSLRPPSPRAEEAAEEPVPGAGAGAPVARQSKREAAHAAEVPAHAAEASGGATAAAMAVASAHRALEKEEAGLLHLEVGHCSSRRFVSRGVSLILLISRSQGGADRPPPPCACEGA
jgi:hypothetical protein